MKKNLTLPTILGLLLLLLGVGTGVYLINRSSNLFLRASPEIVPKQVKITNITEASFSISWVTDNQTTGLVKYGTETSLPYVGKDDRDQFSGSTDNFTTHHITLTNLQPETTYLFKLSSGGKFFDNNGQFYQTKTAKQINSLSLPPNDVAYGNVLDQENQPAEGAIVYLSLAGGVEQSTLTKSSGSWVIPLNLARSSDLATYVSYDQSASVEELFIQASQKGTATAVTTTKKDSPLPNINLGRNYDFRTQAEVEPTPAPEAEANLPGSGFSLEGTPSTTSSNLIGNNQAEITILNPEQGEDVNTLKPEIIGRGPAGKTISITLESSTVYTDEVQVDNSGDWTWTPPNGIEPGEHTITASYFDGNGNEIKISRLFTVLAVGASNLPALTSTPSGTLTPTPFRSVTPTPTRFPSITPTPTGTISATPTLRPSPTSTMTPTPKPTVTSTSGGIPEAGYVLPTILVTLVGFLFVGLGLFINCAKRNA